VSPARPAAPGEGTARRVLLVDWLGRGGIAQTTEAWGIELERAGAEVRVVSRTGRELGASGLHVTGPPAARARLVSHARLCRFATRSIAEFRPDVVVIQNYVVPSLEATVHHAARRAGAQVAFVLHNARHHHRSGGSHVGLSRLVAAADQVVAHSRTEALAIGGPVEVLPLPVQLGMVGAPGASPFTVAPGEHLALHLGVLSRPSKGTDVVERLAAHPGIDPWTFAFAGVGAPHVAGSQSADRFLDAGELVAAVEQASAVVLPYRAATQSAAVALAQWYATVPVVSAVGGIVEQVDDGVTGLLLAPDAPLGAWREALRSLEDDALRTRIGLQGRQAQIEQQVAFVAGICRVVGLPARPPESATSSA
jgi:glycosyltransferase involved in cell wall biosynthesis